MVVTKFWYMHHLFSYKVVLLVICSFFMTSTESNAQFGSGTGNYNFRDFQKKPYYFGMTLGLNNSGYRINQSEFFINNDSINISESSSGGGFVLAGIINLKIGDYFDFRALPGFSFSNRSFEFTYQEESDLRKRSVESVFFEMPFMIRFKSAPYKDKRAFMVAGMKYSYDVQSNSSTRDASTLIKISPHDFQLEVGLGMQFFYPYFIFSPEIKYSRGVGNILIFDDLLTESKVLENVVSQVITISFHFEG